MDPKESPTPGPPEWSLRWYLWEGGFLALGRSSGTVPPHSHHAIQFAIGVDADVFVAGGDGEWVRGRGIVVRPDVTHSFNGDGVLGAMLFVDPECREGQWVLTSLPQEITVVPPSRLDPCTRELRAFNEQPLEAMELGELVWHCVRALCAGPPPPRRLDPRVLDVITKLRGSEGAKPSLEEAAGSVYLSPSRFAHLFTEHVGLPFRRYLLWRKLTRAMVAVGQGMTLSAAAQQGGFSDSAHLTRTFYQMFGIPPSVMMRGEFFAVESPFAES
jgi:AraC family transcriptional regulator